MNRPGVEAQLASLSERSPQLGMMGAKELAARLGVHYVTILKALNRGQVKGVRMGKKWKIPAEEVERVIREGYTNE